MPKFKNNKGIIAFTFENKDYIYGKIGEIIDLPTCEYVKILELKKFITKIKK